MPHKLNEPLSSKFDEALQLASVLHREQARKGTQIPYVSHVLAVTALVLEYGGTEAQAIAALLHDAVEDCGGRPTLAKIEERFGREVAAIVESCTDSFEDEPKRDWRERKEAHLQHLRNCDLASLLVIAADKLHNITAIERDLRDEGQDIWKRFNAEPADQFWYCDSVVEILENRLRNSIVQKLKETLERVRSVCPYAKVATKRDHLNLPMPESRQRLPLRRTFNTGESILIRRGFVPASMDDKWFIYFNSATSELLIHRSWTGYCIYILKLRKKDDGYEISEAWVNRDSEQFSSKDIGLDAEVASWLIDVFLLGKRRDFPSN
ncbi:MAG: HD domain-containing protein [Acidobacteriaceae bacterium]